MVENVTGQDFEPGIDSASRLPVSHPQAGTPLVVPLLPLIENVVFPGATSPLSLRGEQAESLVRAVNKSNGLVALFLQRPGVNGNPLPSDLHSIGTLSRLNEIEWQGDAINVMAEGIEPVALLGINGWEPHVTAKVEPLSKSNEPEPGLNNLANQVSTLYRGLLDLTPGAAQQVLPALQQASSPEQLAYLVASTIPISPDARQAILEMRTTSAKLVHVLTFLKKAHELAAQGKRAANSRRNARQAPAQDSASLAHSLDQATLDRIELEERLKGIKLPSEAARVVQRELDRLSLLSPISPDYNMVRTYLQWLTDLPWRSAEESEIDLQRASAILDRDHYGLEEIKRRILEHLAVRKLRQQRSLPQGGSDTDPKPGVMATQPVLCLVGPPGVGKTSLGRSIAEALNRPFVRISLGGISDEAEIRGHRRTYLGALPGRLIQSLTRVGSNEPVVMLDELDKIVPNVKGDPTAALLDVLDPEQQREFVDHYIDLPFDISCVFFIATANTLESVPEALRDRLEVIRLSGYTEEEKVQIALRHLVPKQHEWHALDSNDLEWDEIGVQQIIACYTREAGVRQLQREIATVCRRVAATIAQEGESVARPIRVNEAFIGEVLGTPRFLPPEPKDTDQPGVVTGMFWTPVGGDIMHIEALMMSGNKTLTITGQLGDVMQESAQAALSYVRANAKELGIDPDFYEHHDLHIHIPSGAVAKDGPSAGIALAVALASLLTGKPVSSDLAMTGELTLRGKVLPVGGIKEKVLAARRAGIHNVLLPAQNRRDLDAIQPEIISDLNILFADTVDEVLDIAFSTT
ncbi:MAG TPA: endopeptidase La [Chloroflexia bacterium]|nr:endopeptidase La [Chloroflexia bacterium]